MEKKNMKLTWDKFDQIGTSKYALRLNIFISQSAIHAYFLQKTNINSKFRINLNLSSVLIPSNYGMTSLGYSYLFRGYRSRLLTYVIVHVFISSVHTINRKMNTKPSENS